MLNSWFHTSFSRQQNVLMNQFCTTTKTKQTWLEKIERNEHTSILMSLIPLVPIYSSRLCQAWHFFLYSNEVHSRVDSMKTQSKWAQSVTSKGFTLRKPQSSITQTTRETDLTKPCLTDALYPQVLNTLSGIQTCLFSQRRGRANGSKWGHNPRT